MNVLTYYYRQVDRRTGEMLGLVTYDDFRPSNDHPDIELEEMTEEAFMAALGGNGDDV